MPLGKKKKKRWISAPTGAEEPCRQMIGVGVRNVVLARGELDRLEGPGYAARRTELRRKAQRESERDCEER